jgi:integrase
MRTPTSTTLRAAWDIWLEAVKRAEILSRSKRPYKPATIRTYEHDMATHVLDDLGAHRLADIRPEDLQALVDRLVGEGRSGSKVRNVLVPLQALYRRHRRDVPVDPTEGLDLPAPSEGRQRAAAPAEAFALLAALPEDERALWATAFLAGLCRGELRALRVSDVDYPAVTAIRVERGWDDEEGPIEPKSRKGRRTVSVASELRRYLLAHKLATGRDGDQLLFGRAADKAFTPTHVRKLARKAWDAANVARAEKELPPLEPIGLHECRHTYVSLMFAAGCSLEEIGDYVGHSSSYMTDRNRHLIEGQRERAAERLDTFLTGAGYWRAEGANPLGSTLSTRLQNRGLQVRVLPPLIGNPRSHEGFRSQGWRRGDYFCPDFCPNSRSSASSASSRNVSPARSM